LRFAYCDDPDFYSEHRVDCKLRIHDRGIHLIYELSFTREQLQSCYKELVAWHAKKIDAAMLRSERLRIEFSESQELEFRDSCAVTVEVEESDRCDGYKFSACGFGMPRMRVLGVARNLRKFLLACKDLDA
jgi:hypothetical protein